MAHDPETVPTPGHLLVTLLRQQSCSWSSDGSGLSWKILLFRGSPIDLPFDSRRAHLQPLPHLRARPRKEMPFPQPLSPHFRDCPSSGKEKATPHRALPGSPAFILLEAVSLRSLSSRLSLHPQKVAADTNYPRSAPLDGKSPQMWRGKVRPECSTGEGRCAPRARREPHSEADEHLTSIHRLRFRGLAGIPSAQHHQAL